MHGRLVVTLAGLMAAATAQAGVRVGVGTHAGPVAPPGLVVQPAAVASSSALAGPVLRIVVGETIVVRRGHGRLDVEVEPERAKVFVDGRYLGRGDKKLVVRAGNHRVRVVLGDGREVAAETVHVDAGQVTRVHLDLN